MAKVTKKNSRVLIKKSNELIEAQYKFNIWEMRVFLSILAQIHKDDVDFKPYTIWYKEVIKTFGLNSSGAYHSLREAGIGLLDKKIQTEYTDYGVKRNEIYNIFGKVDVLSKDGEKTANLDKQGYIAISIHPELKPLLLELQKNFTAYNLKYVTKLGVYSLRVYELLKQYETIKHRKLDVDKMKEMFELTNEYPLFANFYQRIIDPAIKEINEFTDIRINEVERIKEGKKVVALKFFFTVNEQNIEQLKIEFKNKPKKTKQPDLFSKFEENEKFVKTIEIEPINEEKGTLKDELFNLFNDKVVKDFGVSASTLFSLLSNYSKEAIEKAIRVTERKEKDKVKNLSGFFVEALRNGFTDQEEEKRIKRKEQAAEAAKKQEMKKELEADLEELEKTITKEENDTIRQILRSNEAATDTAIEKAKELILKNPYYKKELQKRGHSLDLATIDIEVWRKDEFLRMMVIEGFKNCFLPEFEHIQLFRTKKERLEKQIKELGKS